MKTIAVTGCIGHMGTTTQAIQAVLTIKQKGLKSCYLEMNRTEYLENLLALYGQAEDKKNFVKFSGVDLYKRNFAKTIFHKNWDYAVRDYGSADVDTFEETSFAEQQMKIIVCGSKPNEIFKTQRMLTEPMYDDAFFIFNFVPEDERVSILSLMGKRTVRTFFAGITFDPYILIPDSEKIYQKIIGMSEDENNGT